MNSAREGLAHSVQVRLVRHAKTIGVEALKLTEDELAFYDALEVNDSAVKVLGEPTLVDIARELVATVKKNVTIDWTVRENVRAQLRVKPLGMQMFGDRGEDALSEQGAAEYYWGILIRPLQE